MKLLILTQTVDNKDGVLGFMHGWIAGFAQKCERVTVVCLKSGEYCLPENVRVLSLGKERHKSRIMYFFNFYKYIWQNRQDYDKVFVHMNYEYVILGAIYWRILRKKIALWYAHGHVSPGLRLAEKLVHVIFTSTKSGFRLKSDKVKVIGQGIDTKNFAIYKRTDQVALDKENPALSGAYPNAYRKDADKSGRRNADSAAFRSEQLVKDRNKIVSIGRISPSKDYATLIKAAEILKNKGLRVKVEIIGEPAVTADKKYLKWLEKMLDEKGLTGEIKFIGSVANKDILEYLLSAGVFANMGMTGSLDKAMVEAMAAGLPVVSCNEAMEEALNGYADTLMFTKSDYNELAEKIKNIIKLPDEQYARFSNILRKIAVNNHDLSNFIDKILAGL
ncbi:MAG: glycosyltransferase [Patescibacteria group bacterium]|jgi:glycosyltransferase involved in cell wall biosynthesis